jgi:hypothetical protein
MKTRCVELGDVNLFSLQPRRSGGEGGIRTPDTLSGMPVFKTGAINRSATSPLLQFYYNLEYFQDVSPNVFPI